MKKRLAAILVGGLLVSLAACGNSRSKETYDEPPDRPAAVAQEIVGGESETNQTEETNQLADYNTYVEDISLPLAKLSDGPIFISGDKSAFTLHQLSIATGKMIPIFSFTNSGNYTFSIPVEQTIHLSGWVLEQLFSPDLSKVAVNWTDYSDHSRHVGWVNKDGSVTDVTKAVSGPTTDFSPVPQNAHALFTPDDKLLYFDFLENSYCYVDCDTLSLIRIESPPVISNGVNPISDSILMPTGQLSDRPYARSSRINAGVSSVNTYITVGGYKIASYHGASMCDSINEETVLCLGNRLGNYYIGIAGKGVSEPDMYGCYDAKDSLVITPETDYTIENASYAKGQVVFVACRGKDRSVFLMDASEGSEIKKICSLDKVYRLAFWSENDVPIYGASGEGVTIRKTYTDTLDFSIDGKWKNTGDYTFGQVQSGAIVVFDGKNCNVFSPKDTYAFYKDGSDYKLECTSLLFSETLTFRVEIVDKDHMNIYYGSNYLEMSRVG